MEVPRALPVGLHSGSGRYRQLRGIGLDRGRLPSEILRSGSLEEGPLADRAKLSFLKVSAVPFIF